MHIFHRFTLKLSNKFILSVEMCALLKVALILTILVIFCQKTRLYFLPHGVELNHTHICIPRWVLHNTPLTFCTLFNPNVNFHILRYGSSACISVSGGHIGFDCSYLMPSNWDVHLGFFSSLGTYLAIEKQKLPQLKNVYRT